MCIRSLQGSRCQVPVKVIPLGLFSSQTRLSLWTSLKLPLRHWCTALQGRDVEQNAVACTAYLPRDFRLKSSFRNVAQIKYSGTARDWKQGRKNTFPYFWSSHQKRSRLGGQGVDSIP